MELTEKDIKTLNAFSLYCQSQGARIVTIDANIFNCALEFTSKVFHDSESNIIVQGYDKIINLVNKIFEEFETEATEQMEECENYGQMIIFFDCTERTFEIKLYEEIRTTSESDYGYELSDSAFNSVKKYMTENNYTEATITFEGSGDSGYINDEISFNSDNKLSSTLSLSRSFSELEDYIYDALEEILPGWENDEGSQGECFISLAENEMFININVNSNSLEEVGVLGRYEF